MLKNNPRGGRAASGTSETGAPGINNRPKCRLVTRMLGLPRIVDVVAADPFKDPVPVDSDEAEIAELPSHSRPRSSSIAEFDPSWAMLENNRGGTAW